MQRPYRRLILSEAVRQAFMTRKGVVALESAVITHGMAYPDNFNVVRDMEAAIREEGAQPATIAVLNGIIHVGLDDVQLRQLSQADDVHKISRRDLPIALSQGQTGGATVATTMMIAAKVGISVFATGGIGGVHRGADHSFDISADLEELARTNVCVVCAGAKSNLFWILRRHWRFWKPKAFP